MCLHVFIFIYIHVSRFDGVHMFTIKLQRWEIKFALAAMFAEKESRFWATGRNYEYWNKAFLPEWVQRIGYSSKTRVPFLLGKHGGIPVSHLGKSRLKFFLARNSAFKIATSGSTCGKWADPQQAPPFIDMSELGNFVYDWTFIMLQRLKFVRQEFVDKKKNTVRNPGCGYGYYTKSEPVDGFSGDKGKQNEDIYV